MIPPPPELELETRAVSLSGVVERFAPTFHSWSFFIARFGSRCWFPTSFRSCNLTINQPRHKIHRVVQLSVPFQCFRTSLYRPSLDHAVLVDLPNQMPRSHDEPTLPSWTPDSFASSAELSKGLWNLDIINSSNGVLQLDRTTNLFLRSLCVGPATAESEKLAKLRLPKASSKATLLVLVSPSRVCTIVSTAPFVAWSSTGLVQGINCIWKFLVVYCPFSLDISLHGSDQRPAIILEDHSQVTQLLQRPRTECGTRPFLGAVLYTHGSSSWAPAIHTKILCSCLCSPFQSSRYMAQSSTVCFTILPRLEGSTKRLVQPVQSTIGLFKSHVREIRKLFKEFTPSAVYPHIFREKRSQPRLDKVLLSL